MNQRRSETKRQHTVPVMFLSAFSSNGNESRSGKIIQYSKDGDAPATLSIGDASVKKHLYTLDGLPEKDRMTLEKWLGDIETKATVPLKRLRNGFAPNNRERLAISNLLAVQFLRTQMIIRHAFEQDTELSSAKNSIRFIEKNRAELETKHGPSAIAGLVRKMEEDGQGLIRTKPERLLNGFRSAPKLACIINSMEWRIERSPKGIAFASSDNPVYVRRRGRPRDPCYVGFERDDIEAEMLVAISPQRFLIGHWREGPGYSECKITSSRVRYLNLLTILMADRFVFASMDSDEFQNAISRESDFRLELPDLVEELLSE